MSLINHPKLSNHLCIFFDKLEFQTSIGIHEHEMRKKQSVVITNDIEIDVAREFQSCFEAEIP